MRDTEFKLISNAISGLPFLIPHLSQKMTFSWHSVHKRDGTQFMEGKMISVNPQHMHQM